MSDERNYKMFLKDMLDSMENIDDYLEGLDYEDFIEDQKTIDAVVRNIEIIGEATKQIPEHIQKEYPKIPWKKMAGNKSPFILAIYWNFGKIPSMLGKTLVFPKHAADG